MGVETAALDEQIERLRGGDTLTENEVRALCEKVSNTLSCNQRKDPDLAKLIQIGRLLMQGDEEPEILRSK